MLIDRDVRFSLLLTIDFLKSEFEWVSVQDIINYLERRTMRIYDRRSIYGHIKALEQFELIQSKHIRHNQKVVRWIWTN
jgi:hypothetical protein